MNKIKQYSPFLVAFTAVLIASYSARAEFLEEFPGECAYATDREPLPGHVMRLGFIGWTRYGWSFFFPDRRITNTLQRVYISDKVGLIGQNPEEDLSGEIRARTPNGSFVVAQIFVGDSNVEPVVTCISRAVLLERYRPSYYGAEFSWLNRGNFGRWLGYRKYSSWQWKKSWSRDFDNIRRNFKVFKRDDDRRRRLDRDRFDDRNKTWRRYKDDDRRDDRRRDKDDDRRDDRRRDKPDKIIKVQIPKKISDAVVKPAAVAKAAPKVIADKVNPELKPLITKKPDDDKKPQDRRREGFKKRLNQEANEDD